MCILNFHRDCQFSLHKSLYQFIFLSKMSGYFPSHYQHRMLTIFIFIDLTNKLYLAFCFNVSFNISDMGHVFMFKIHQYFFREILSVSKNLQIGLGLRSLDLLHCILHKGTKLRQPSLSIRESMTSIKHLYILITN